MTELRGDRIFWACVGAFALIYGVFFPATYAIEDEFNILSLAVALSRGTVFLDLAGLDLDADFAWRGRIISKFSPFHAALFVPALWTDWRFAFVVTAAFALGGAFIVRSMLRREGLSTSWTILYFLCPGIWFYSRTLMAAVPASVMVLLGARLLLDRTRPRPAAAGAALAFAGLLHPWFIPIAAALVAGWCLEAPRDRLRPVLSVALGAAPGVAALLFYNWRITGHPLKSVYSLMGIQNHFDGDHLPSFLVLYLSSLLVMPFGGWAALSARWGGGFGVPLAVATTVAAAAFYYYRDGMGYGLPGLLPAQRFILPATVLACVPAARFLAARVVPWRFEQRVAALALVVFVFGFSLVSFGHGVFLNAHAHVQRAIKAEIVDGAKVVVSDRAFKEFAPVLGTWRLSQPRELPPRSLAHGAYLVWVGPPEAAPPPEWFAGRTPRRVRARSWVWNRDLLIAEPTTVSSYN